MSSTPLFLPVVSNFKGKTTACEKYWSILNEIAKGYDRGTDYIYVYRKLCKDEIKAYKRSVPIDDYWD